MRVDIERDKVQGVETWRVNYGHIVGVVDGGGCDIRPCAAPNVGHPILKHPLPDQFNQILVVQRFEQEESVASTYENRLGSFDGIDGVVLVNALDLIAPLGKNGAHFGQISVVVDCSIGDEKDSRDAISTKRNQFFVN